MLKFLAEGPLDHVLPHPVFGEHLQWFTNQGLMALVAGVLMLIIFPRMFSKPDPSAPTGAKNFFESILEFLRVEVFRPALKEHTDKFVPFLWTVFFFILFCNILGCIPLPEFFLVTSTLLSGGRFPIEHLGGTATGSISTTATLAICAFFFIHFHGINTVAQALMDGTYGHHGGHEEHSSNGSPGHEAAHDLQHLRGDALPADVPGNLDALGNPIKHYRDDEYLKGPVTHADDHGEHHAKLSPGMAILLAVPYYLWNFAPHPFAPKEGESKIMWLADVPMFGMLLLLELLGALIKPFALAMRLFANMVAGHVMLAVLVSLIVAVPGIVQFAIGVPLGLLHLGIQLLEIFVAVLQAYIFTFLTTLFIASSVAPEH